MSSERKIAANRRNARKSRGPRTLAGKVRASRNACRHGLAAISHDNLAYCAEIEQAAKAICEGDSDPLLFDQALIIGAYGTCWTKLGAKSPLPTLSRISVAGSPTLMSNRSSGLTSAGPRLKNEMRSMQCARRYPI